VLLMASIDILTPSKLLIGTLSMAGSVSAPLLVVFGGINVGGRRSGLYMWDYLDKVTDRFHIFVAYDNNVNGTLAYSSLMSTLQAQGGAPNLQILYLFSGGYRPGMTLLNSKGPGLFSSIYLVDIWMGSNEIGNFYKSLADKNAAKMTYISTKNGASNDKAREYITNKVGPRGIWFEGHHMETNTRAVALL
jgi:hypothetical protein